MKPLFFLCILSLCLVSYSCAISFSEHDALQSYYFSASSYCWQNISSTTFSCPFCNIQGYTNGFKVFNTAYCQSNDLFAFSGVLESERKIFFSFRGTESWKNWVVNAKFSHLPYNETLIPGGVVHDGFLKGYYSLKDQVLSDLHHLQQLHPEFEIVVTGHSLGGALSYLFACDLSLSNTPFSLFTFGCPRIGNKAFSDFFSSRIQHHRFTYGRDPVPMVPPQSLHYYHTSTEFFVTKGDNSVKHCNGSGEDPSCIDKYSIPNVLDHLNYFGIYIGPLACH
eukprot:GCRY01000367.1.p1 GENE.GCRY01000367.1~~GCRY01000367.1.p1  ORF type:complete len:280 (+),score=14.12 GCRY01000367.1:121-960(+)